jgi:hypothetical protein
MWCIEFWDHDQWDEMAGTRNKYKRPVVERAQRMNKETTDEIRRSVYGGHRFRVRKVKAS